MMDRRIISKTQAYGTALMQPVLVIDDDDSIREFVELVLQDEGYDVITATDGADALQIIALRQPSLILLDMRMPIMDGWEFARSYRETAGPHVPIVVLSAARETSE